MRRTTIESIIDRLEPITESGCLIWPSITKKGYGYVRYNGKQHRVHRLLYELLVSPIPDGMVIDHLCRVRCCGNIAHMEVVTNRENVLRGIGPSAIRAKKTHCVHGHPFIGSNLYTGKARRACRECKKWFFRKRRGTLLLHSP